MSKQMDQAEIVEAAVGDVCCVKRSNAWRGFDLTPEHMEPKCDLRVRVSVGWSNEIMVTIVRQEWSGERSIAHVTISRAEFHLAVKLTVQAIEAMLAEIPVNVPSRQSRR